MTTSVPEIPRPTRQQEPPKRGHPRTGKGGNHRLTVNERLIGVLAFAILQESTEICCQSPVPESAVVPPSCSWMPRDEFTGSFSLSSCPAQIPLLSPPPSVRQAKGDCFYYYSQIERGKRTLSGSGSAFGLCT